MKKILMYDKILQVTPHMFISRLVTTVMAFLVVGHVMCPAQSKYADSTYYELAVSLLKVGDTESTSEAYDLLKKEISEHKDNGYACLLISKICIDRELYDESILYLTKAITCLPSDDKESMSYAYAFRALAHNAKRDTSSAVKDVISSICTDHNDVVLEVVKCVAFSSYDLMDTALQKKMQERPKDHYLPFCLGLINEDRSHFREALIFSKKSLSMRFEPACAALAARANRELLNLKDALQYIDKALSSDPYNVEFSLSRAEILYWSGRPEDSISQLSECLKHHSDEAELWINKANYELWSGQYDQSIKDYSKAISISDKDFIPYYGRGVAYKLKGCNSDAKIDFEEVLRIDVIPAEPGSRAEFALFFLGMSEKAERLMECILEESYDKYSLYDAACLYSLMNKSDLAIKYLSKSLEAGYRNLYHIIHDINLASIRDTKDFSDLLSKFGICSGSVPQSMPPRESYPVYVRYEIPYSVAFGVKKVRLLVNGLPAVAIFDSQCKSIEISEAQANYLYENHFFPSNNIKSKTFSSTGKIVNGDTILFSKVSIGELLLNDVSVKVVGRDRAPITLGGKFLCGNGKILIGSNSLIVSRIQ